MSTVAAEAPAIALACRTYRCIAARFPPVDPYTALTAPEHADQFRALEALTRLRAAGAAGASPIDAAFDQEPAARQGGRFNGDFSAYYCALEEATAVGEAVFHRARFLREAGMPATTATLRIVVADLAATALADIRGRLAALHAPDDYGASKRFGAALYQSNAEASSTTACVWPAVSALRYSRRPCCSVRGCPDTWTCTGTASASCMSWSNPAIASKGVNVFRAWCVSCFINLFS